MHTNQSVKKVPCDWHQAYISAALKAKGTNLSALSAASGYSRNGLRNALYRPYPKAEKIIAKAIGVEPEEIWPSRYAL
jgi:Ner family transcriptional regulator